MSRPLQISCLTLAATSAVALALTGSAQATNIVLSGWGAITADIGGGALVWSDTQAAKTATFTYWRTDTGRAPFGGAIGTASEPVLVRTSAGIATGARVRATGTAKGYVTIAPGASYAGPVIWCCDTTATTEVVVSSDGRDGAPIPAGAGFDGSRVRWISGSATGAVLGSASPIEGDLRGMSVSIPGNTGPGLASIATGVAAWAATGGTSITMGVPTDDGVSGVRTVKQGGTVRSVFATPGFVVTVVKNGSRAKVVRTDVASGATRTVWTGSGTPVVAGGGSAIVIGTGTKVFSSKGGSKARAAGTAKGTVAAVATDGRRIVVFERITRKVTVKKRTTNVKSTVGRVIGSVR
jgi:hypothetical protein